MKSGKVPGVVGVTLEMIKAAFPVGVQWLYWLFQVILEQKKVPKDCRKGLIIHISKDDKKECNVYVLGPR